MFNTIIITQKLFSMVILHNSTNLLTLKEVPRSDFVYETENWQFTIIQHCTDVAYHIKCEKEILSEFL